MKINKKQAIKVLVILLILTLAISYGLPWLTTGQVGKISAGMVISFEGAGKGLDPQGERFDVNELKRDEVLQTAIDQAGLTDTVTASELKARLYILPVAGKDALKDLLTLTEISGKTQPIKEQIIYPTSFVIGIKDMGVPSFISDRTLLEEVFVAYKAQLKDKYLSTSLSQPAYEKEDILQMDYPEMMKMIGQEIDGLIRYVRIYSENEPQYVSNTTGISFADLEQQAVLIKAADVENMQSLVDYYQLTRDQGSRILYEEAMLRRAQVTASKLQDAQYTVADILSIYDNSSNYIFASGDESSPLTPVENQFYGDLVGRLVDKQADAISARYEKDDIQKAIDKLMTSSLSGAAYADMTSEIEQGAKEVLEHIDTLKDTTRQMADEYYDQAIGNKVSVSPLHYQMNQTVNPALVFILLAALYFVIKIVWMELQKSNHAFVTKIRMGGKKHGKQ